ncbi:hypothetical protein [Corallibacter sp.]|uniref:hypothetical protein n=1 Tax=Corallibacter sp. TaxID=2038084 RepID=UPI003A91C3DB
MNFFKNNLPLIKFSLLPFCLIIHLHSYSQDIITKSDGEKIEAKIDLIGTDEVKYKKYNHLDGPSYMIKKSNISEIKFNNGIVQSFNNSKEKDEISLKETKEFIIKTINKHGFEEDTFNRKYKASFEGDYLRLIVLRRNGVDHSNDGILYDFSNVYSFHRVSKRSDKKAFINIWVSILKNKKKNKWDKHKLIMRVDGIPQAESILNALKHYNKLLLDKQKTSNSKF